MNENKELESAYNCGRNSGYIDGFVDGYKAGVKDAKPKWILVTERLPEENGWYIVTHDNVIYTKKREIKSGVSLFFEKFESDVIAWMSLPEPLPKPYGGK